MTEWSTLCCCNKKPLMKQIRILFLSFPNLIFRMLQANEPSLKVRAFLVASPCDRRLEGATWGMERRGLNRQLQPRGCLYCPTLPLQAIGE